MSERFVDRLTPVLADGDILAARELLDSLDDAELREARGWFGRSAGWFRDRSEHVQLRVGPDEKHYEVYQRTAWIVAMCAVRLCGPTTAAKRVPWHQLRARDDRTGETELLRLLEQADVAWVAPFVEAASHRPLARDRYDENDSLSRLLRGAAVHHHLPCPTGATFLRYFSSGRKQLGSVADTWAADPLMPDVLFRYLASGLCGDSPELPSALAEVAAHGVVDRAQLLEHVLSALTAPQRPKSQEVLVGILAALELRSSEVAGGLDFLLGVLSTSYRPVVSTLLPHAIELVEDADSLLQLTTVLVSRPEKGPRTTLLKALKGPELRARVGNDAVLDALRLLGSGDDAAFNDKVARAVASLGGEAAGSQEPAPSATGLWELAATPSLVPEEVMGLPHQRRAWYAADWKNVLRWPLPRRGMDRPSPVDRELMEMQFGTFDPDRLRRGATFLLETHQLAMGTLVQALEDLFLGGGLRSTWAAALDIADAGCAAAQRPPGLAELLRCLSGFVVEVPGPQPVPPHIAALALASGTSKAQSEALRLAAGLMQVSEAEAARSLHGSAPAPTPELRGLWRRSAPVAPLPSTRRLPTPTDPLVDRAEDLGRLREALSWDFNYHYEGYLDVAFGSRSNPLGPPSSLTTAQRLLTATVAAIHRHGPDAVRAALTDIERRYPPLDVVEAIDLWVAGVLDVSVFWRVARQTTTGAQLREKWRLAGASNTEIKERLGSMPDFATALSLPDDPELGLVLPSSLSGGAQHLAFLRAVEGLLRAEQHPTLLSTPTWADGTLDLDDLLARLWAMHASTPRETAIGPIDLVQALHRLRPVDPAGTALVPDGLRTDTAFTDPDGVEGWDASALVRTWIEQGGLPVLDPDIDDDGCWSTSTTAPVPFTSLAALPPSLSNDPWSPGGLLPTLRMLPRWADRCAIQAYAEAHGMLNPHFPSQVSGPFGVPWHDYLLALMSRSAHGTGANQMLVDLSRHDRLVPGAAATAALGRHEAGTLYLTALTTVFQRAFEEDLSGLWPTALAIAEALCGASQKPSALPQLLRLLTSCAHEVPEPVVPDGLRTFAGSKGRTKSHVEARALLAALEQGRRRMPEETR